MGLAFPKPNSTRDQHTRVQQQREHWLAVRKAVLTRDAHRCRCCGTRHQLDVHHLIARSLGGADSEKIARRFAEVATEIDMRIGW